MKLAWAGRPMVDTVKMEVRFETLDGDVITRIITAGSVDQPRYHWLLK
jgi:molybdopterin-binding protein